MSEREVLQMITVMEELGTMTDDDINAILSTIHIDTEEYIYSND